MSKFNKAGKVQKPRKHLVRTIKKAKLSIEFIVCQPEIIHGILRENKYRKKTESNIRKAVIDE